MSSQLTIEMIESSFIIFGVLEYKNFTRVILEKNMKDSVLIKRNHEITSKIKAKLFQIRYKGTKDNSIKSDFIELFSSDHRLQDFSISREKFLTLRNILQSKYGNEGAKRYAEISLRASDLASLHDSFLFWGNFRTFLDLEPLIMRGLPYRVDHFSSKFQIINDTKGARMEFPGGAGIQASSLSKPSKPSLGNFDAESN